MNLKQEALRVLEIEGRALLALKKNLTDDFIKAARKVAQSRGRVVVTGIGKSGLIGKKISATLASTGTPSFFMHPAEAFHGDLGMLRRGDSVLALSYSGESEEILRLIPFLKDKGVTLICFSGNPQSTLACNSDFFISVKIKREACPLELAPTTSTTAMLAMGDAWAMALMRLKKINPETFARNHPGGSLGKKLLLKVENVMKTKDLPLVQENTRLVPDLIETISKGRLGLAVVMRQGRVVGLITDGDLRRTMEKNPTEFVHLNAQQVMTRHPLSVKKTMRLSQAEALMNKNKITSLLVTDRKKLVGIVHIHDLYKT